MKNATFIYILASCALIVAFAYADYVQDTTVVGFAGEYVQEQPIVEEVIVEDERVTIVPPAYVLASHRPKTYAQLYNDLERIPDPPYPYEVKEYDCSQMSAYMEYQLENKGYDTTISGSLTRGHAWVTVHNIIGHDRIDIECIPSMHIKPVHHEIEVSYDDITEALNGVYPKEWQWWLDED